MMRYHSTFGYTYIPSLKKRVVTPEGGYLLRTNSFGFRSEREFEADKKLGVRRALLFGDSQAAGDGVANLRRFTDLAEKKIPDFEIYNFALSGAAPDQQLLVYREFQNILHNMVIICIFVDNILRVNRSLNYRSDGFGNKKYFPKPYFLLEDGILNLYNSPVPKEPLSDFGNEKEKNLAFNHEQRMAFRTPHFLKNSAKDIISQNSFGRTAARIVFKNIVNYNPLPEYDSADNVEWRILYEILNLWVAESTSPVAIVPLPLFAHIEQLVDPKNYQDRFHEFATDNNCCLFDPLPDIWALENSTRARIWSGSSGHFSPSGHEFMAHFLAESIGSYLSESESG